MDLLRVAVAAATSFLLGGFWYSPAAFLHTWNREAGVAGADKHHGPIRFAIAYLGAFVGAFVLQRWLGPAPSLEHALIVSAEAGAGLVGGSFAINYSLGFKSWKLWAIDAGYHLVQFLLFGVVFGLWH